MKLLYQGKTKDVFQLDNEDSLRFQFSNRVTRNDAGEIDPGGNNRGGEVENQALACLMMTTTIFRELAAKGFRTHMTGFDLEALTMDVYKATLFKPGLEWIARWVATGSFVRRYAKIPDLKNGMHLLVPAFEITLKDDEGGDPLIVPSAVVGTGIMTSACMDELWQVNREIMAAIRELFSLRGLDLWDIKVEYGLDLHGRPMLIDEISTGSCRAFRAGTTERVEGLELARLFR